MNDDVLGQAPYDGLPPYQKHSTTSREAAESIVPHLERLEQVAYDYILSSGGATDAELYANTELTENSYRARRISLTSKVLVRDSGTTRRTKSGRQAVVWVAVIR